MQVKLIFSNKISEFPPAYNHQLQSAIYKALADDEEYSDFLHDSGYENESAHFKLFTFGQLRGNSEFHNKKLIFRGNFSVKIRSCDNRFITALISSLERSGCVKLFDTTLELSAIELSDMKILRGDISIETDSPIVCSRVDEGKTEYFAPDSPDFYKVLSKNIRGKTAAADLPLDGNVSLKLLNAPRKVVTSFKKIWVTAYSGRFRLEGDPELLNFLYNVGLGQRSSEGFGMFDVT